MLAAACACVIDRAARARRNCSANSPLGSRRLRGRPIAMPYLYHLRISMQAPSGDAADPRSLDEACEVRLGEAERPPDADGGQLAARHEVADGPRRQR